MSAARSVEAVFAPTFQTLSVIPTGPGSLSASSGAISGCEAGGHGTCSGPYQEGSIVTLTASPQPHNHVTWGEGECKVVPSPNVAKSKSAPPKRSYTPPSRSTSTPSAPPPPAPARSAPPAPPPASPTAPASAAPARANTPRPPPSPSPPPPTPTTTSASGKAAPMNPKTPAKSPSAPPTRSSTPPSVPTPTPSSSSPPAKGRSGHQRRDRPLHRSRRHLRRPLYRSLDPHPDRDPRPPSSGRLGRLRRRTEPERMRSRNRLRQRRSQGRLHQDHSCPDRRQGRHRPGTGHLQRRPLRLPLPRRHGSHPRRLPRRRLHLRRLERRRLLWHRRLRTHPASRHLPHRHLQRQPAARRRTLRRAPARRQDPGPGPLRPQRRPLLPRHPHQAEAQERPAVVKSSSPAAGTTLPAADKVDLTLAHKPRKKH